MTCLNLSSRAALLLFMIANESSATLHFYLTPYKIQTRTRGVAVAQKQVLQGLLSTNTSKAAAATATAIATAASSASAPTANPTSEAETTAAGTASTAGTVLSGKVDVDALTMTLLIDKLKALQCIELHYITLHCIATILFGVLYTDLSPLYGLFLFLFLFLCYVMHVDVNISFIFMLSFQTDLTSAQMKELRAARFNTPAGLSSCPLRSRSMPSLSQLYTTHHSVQLLTVEEINFLFFLFSFFLPLYLSNMSFI